MSPFRSGRVFKARVYDRDDVGHVRTLSTENDVEAREFQSFLKRMRKARRWDVLDLIIARAMTVAEAYDADVAGSLTTLSARLMAEMDDVNLEPHVAKWRAWKAKAKKGAGMADIYHQQVRRLIPGGKPFSRSRFTARAIRKHLRALDVEDSTRNRHKAGISSFADYLVDEEVIERNPVRDVRGWSEGEGRIVYYEREQARTLIAALPQPFQAIEALMVGAGLEWQAIERLTVRDVDLAASTVMAHGGKTRWRNRLCRIVEAWAVDHVRPALAGKIAGARVFDLITERKALGVHHDTVEAVGLPDSTLHDWRHTHAVLMLRDGYKPTVVAHQLGHRDTSLVWKRYGRFVVDARDYELPVKATEATPKAEGQL